MIDHRLPSFRSLCFWVLLANALALGAAGCGGTPCELSADCAGSDEVREAGRCAPEAVCLAGRCSASCPSLCMEVRADVNPCASGQLCNRCAWGACLEQSPAEQTGGRCTSFPIACTTTEHCPRYLPGDGEWSCVQGVCQFPGYQYTAR